MCVSRSSGVNSARDRLENSILCLVRGRKAGSVQHRGEGGRGECGGVERGCSEEEEREKRRGRSKRDGQTLTLRQTSLGEP